MQWKVLWTELGELGTKLSELGFGLGLSYNLDIAPVFPFKIKMLD